MSAGDFKVLQLVRVSSDMRRFKELGDIYKKFKETGLSEDDAAAKTLQTLAKEEGLMLWKMAGKEPPPDWFEPEKTS